ncbi:lactate utilization protein [Thiohalocapsa marina]|uniref:Lactate utilization protein n=1 Tax=Thiohalocapsa marina TaxID=424902 RepID=A0A5M8FFS5_9GAMM|nr:lactate utilization protein [Thiohalocapsa marina]KAA6181891.1 lactate utilization protein [Thiohalocapsa marina]
MTDTRTQILQRLRSANTATASVPGSEPASPSAATLTSAPTWPVRRFDWGPEELTDRFRRGIEAVRAEVHAVGDDWPRQLAALLQARGARNLRYGPDGPLAPALIQGWPTAEGVPRLVPHDQPIEACRRALFDDTDAGFTACRAGIAETGSLVLWPTPAEPRLLSLVPPIHCVLLEADRIVSTLHELMQREGWAQRMPTNALLISGPSKSADIEQTLAYGVHGPAELIVLLRTTSAAGTGSAPPATADTARTAAC